MTTCEHCRHFHPDRINPPAGIGRCMHPARHGYFYPAQKHHCRDHEDAKPAHDEKRAP